MIKRIVQPLGKRPTYDEVKAKAQWRLFRKSVGESEVMYYGNLSSGTMGPITCELCGTELPELDSDDASYNEFRFLGIDAVMECCGKAVDVVYKEWGDRITEQRLNDFASDPLSQEHWDLRDQITRAVEAWAKSAEKATTEASKVKAHVNRIR